MSRRERLAMAIFTACFRMYPEIYSRRGSPSVTWADLHAEQRALFLLYADAAAEFLGVQPWTKS